MKVNEKQRNVLIAVAVIIAGMLLFPPFHRVRSGNVLGAGYYWLFDAPQRFSVDVGTLFMQWLGVLIIGGVMFFVFKDEV